MKKSEVLFVSIALIFVSLSMCMIFYIMHINKGLKEQLESTGTSKSYKVLLEECQADYDELQKKYDEISAYYNELKNSVKETEEETEKDAAGSGYDIVFGGEDNESAENNTENTFFIEGCAITYEKTEILYNMADEKCIAFFFTFTNNANETKTFDYLTDFTAFQNGVEIEMSLWHVNDESKNGELEIKPGTTVTVAEGFVLRDNSDVTLEVKEWISFDDKTLFSITVPVA